MASPPEPTAAAASTWDLLLAASTEDTGSRHMNILDPPSATSIENLLAESLMLHGIAVEASSASETRTAIDAPTVPGSSQVNLYRRRQTTLHLLLI